MPVKSPVAQVDNISMRPLFSIFLLSILSGCAGGKANSSLLETSLGPTLNRMWDAHGGLNQWKRFGGASFSYEAVVDGTRTEISQVLIKFADPLTVWCRQDAAGPWVNTSDGLPVPPGNSSDPGLELSVLSLASLFHLPFLLDSHGWVLRQAMQVRPAKTEIEFEASRRKGSRAFGPFLLRLPAGQHPGLLSKIHYFCRHPLLGEGVYRAEFLKYGTFQGILVATERNHYRVSGPRDVLTLPGKQNPEALWREKLNGIRFLQKKEVLELLGKENPAAAKG